jgi:hypothetical protein
VRSQLRSGILCSCLLFLTLQSRLGAQGPPQQPAPEAPAPPSSSQPAAPQAPAQTSPAPQQTPTARPPSQAPSIELRDTGGDGYSIEPVFWLPKEAPILQLGRTAKASTTDTTTGAITPGQTVPGNLNFPGSSPYALGAVVTIPTGHENSIEISAFRLDGKGSTTETQNLILFGDDFTQGDLLVTTYRIQNFKLSWNYLSFPYPSKGAKFRLKTLYEVQYLGISTVVNAPNDVNAIPTTGNKDIIFPTLGLGVEYHPSKYVRLEAKASGFGWPRRADIWDIEGSAVVRVGPIEAFVGGKGYHFKTSPNQDQYFSDTLWGPSVGVRWIFR